MSNQENIVVQSLSTLTDNQTDTHRRTTVPYQQFRENQQGKFIDYRVETIDIDNRNS
jgi:hypothetical protein